MDVDRAVEGLEFLALDEIHQALAREHPSGVFGQRHQKIELVAGEKPLVAVDADHAGFAVDLKPPEAQHRLRRARRSPAAAQNGADARLQLARVEGLGEIVVGPNFESDDAVDVLAARGQHKDRRLGAGAKYATDLEPVDIRQHHVENDGVERRRIERGEPVAAVETALDDKPGRAQIVRQHGGEARIVVDDKKPLRHDAPDRR